MCSKPARRHPARRSHGIVRRASLGADAAELRLGCVSTPTIRCGATTTCARSPSPRAHDLSKSYEFVANTFGETARSFGPALNVNTLGEVPDSSWFTNRLGQHDMTLEEVLRGPNQVDGPAAGRWQVTGRPDSGITPKFTIRDARGDTYLIKLDPASNPELPSSVELISTKLFHAIGYHVPEDFIVHFTPDRLVVAPGARIRNAVGDRVPIQQADIDRWLRDVPRRRRRIDTSARQPVGARARSSASSRSTVVARTIRTTSFRMSARRELRGLRLFAAWLNHDDARAINSIDTYVEEDGRRYIRHYLQDFGSNLGSGSTSAQQPRGGYEYLIEPRQDRERACSGSGSTGATGCRPSGRRSVGRQHRSGRVRSQPRGRPSTRILRSSRWTPPTPSGRRASCRVSPTP